MIATSNADIDFFEVIMVKVKKTTRKLIDRIKKLEPGEKVYWFRVIFGALLGLIYAFVPGIPPRPSLFKFLLGLFMIMFIPVLIVKFLLRIPFNDKSIGGLPKLVLWYGTVTGLFEMIFVWSLIRVALCEIGTCPPL